MNWRSTVVWVVLAVVVVAVVYFGVMQQPQTEPPSGLPTLAPPPPAVFSGLAADRITALRVQSPITPTAFALMRGTDGVWRITEGVVSSTVSLPAPADPTQVANLLQTLVAMQSAPITGTNDLKVFGLVTPTLTLTFTASSGVAEGQQFELRIGFEPVKGRGYFAQKGGTGDVYVVPSSFVTSLLGFIRTAPVQPTPTPTAAPPTPEVTVTATGTPLPPAASAQPPSGTANPTPSATPVGPQPPAPTVAPTP